MGERSLYTPTYKGAFMIKWLVRLGSAVGLLLIVTAVFNEWMARRAGESK